MDSFLGFRSLTNSSFLGGRSSSAGAGATPRGCTPATRDGAPADDTGTSHSTGSSQKSGAASSSSTLARMDRLLEPRRFNGGAGQEEPDVEDSEEAETEAQAQAPAQAGGGEEAAAAADDGADAGEGEGRIGRRPCKAKRDRYRSLVDRHLEIIRSDPHGFSMDAVVVPQFVAQDARLTAKFRARLENFVREVLEGGGDAAQMPAGVAAQGWGAQASAATGSTMTPGSASTEAWAPPGSAWQADQADQGGLAGQAGHAGRLAQQSWRAGGGRGGGRGGAARGGRGRARGSVTMSL